MKSDVVIIGAGVSGLATGALLAKAGHRVTVLEKGNQPGGRAYTYEDKGFTLNYGPHAIYRPQTGVLAEILRRLDVPAFGFGYAPPTRSF
ncbi:MAG TPA: FAD-dependent oxidoreductase, partial [Dehalococcoidia bacterium]